MLNRLRALCATALFALVSANALYMPKAHAQATQVPNAEQCFQATTGINGMLGALGAITGGAGGASGTYGGVALTGGSGTTATANITVSGGAVTGVALLNPGKNYVVGDTLSASSGTIGGVTGFSVPVASISINSSLAGGAVGMYQPGTLTYAQTWQNAGQTILNTNPISLDSNGCAIIYGTGTYRQILYDSLGNEVWDQLTSVAPVNPYYAGVASGSANAITITDPTFTGTNGQTILFIASATNGSGGTTLDPSTYGAVTIYKNGPTGPTPLTGGEIVTGNLVIVTYSSTIGGFILQNPAPSNSYINVADFGADPTDTNDSTTAFQSWWNACMATQTGAYGGAGGHVCFMPPGNYKLNSSLVWDFKNNLAGGCLVLGSGQNATILNFASGQNLSIVDSNGVGFFYGTFNNFGVTGSYTSSSGGLLQLGEHSLTDAMNGFSFSNIFVKNLVNAATGTAALEANLGATNSFFNVTANDGCTDPYGNCSSGGDAFRNRAFSMLTINTGSFSGATYGIEFAPTSFAIIGNVYNGLDLEVDFNLLYVNSANARQNVINGGQWSWCSTANPDPSNTCASSGGSAIVVNAASFDNVIKAPNIGFTTTVLDYISNTYAAAVTLDDVTGLLGEPTTPGIGATGATYQNLSGRRVMVTAYGSTVTGLCYGTTGASCLNTAGSVILNPGDKTVLSYSGGTPGWAWMNAN